jgi:hypothetical protein
VPLAVGVPGRLRLVSVARVERNVREGAVMRALRARYDPTTLTFPLTARRVHALRGMADRFDALRGVVEPLMPATSTGVPERTLQRQFWARALELLDAMRRIADAAWILVPDGGSAASASFAGAAVSSERTAAPGRALVGRTRTVEVRGAAFDGARAWSSAVPAVWLAAFSADDLFVFGRRGREIDDPPFTPTPEESAALRRLWLLRDQFEKALDDGLPRELTARVRDSFAPGWVAIDVATDALNHMPIQWLGRFNEVERSEDGNQMLVDAGAISRRGALDLATGSHGLRIDVPVAPPYALIGKEGLELGDATEQRLQSSLRLEALEGAIDLHRTRRGFLVVFPAATRSAGAVEARFGVSRFIDGEHRILIGWTLDLAPLPPATSGLQSPRSSA